jgi:hypothetical protein
MPRPAIIMPATVKISRIGEVRVKGAHGKAGWPVVGHVRPFANGRFRVWTAHDRDGGLLRSDNHEPLKAFDGQREAVRKICEMQGLWPQETDAKAAAQIEFLATSCAHEPLAESEEATPTDLLWARGELGRETTYRSAYKAREAKP